MTPTLTNRPPSTLSDDLEKKEEFQVEEVTGSQQSADDAALLASFDEKKRKRMYRKIDVRLLPMLALLYLFACEWESKVEALWHPADEKTSTAPTSATPRSRASPTTCTSTARNTTLASLFSS